MYYKSVAAGEATNPLIRIGPLSGNSALNLWPRDLLVGSTSNISVSCSCACVFPSSPLEPDLKLHVCLTCCGFFLLVVVCTFYAINRSLHIPTRAFFLLTYCGFFYLAVVCTCYAEYVDHSPFHMIHHDPTVQLVNFLTRCDPFPSIVVCTLRRRTAFLTRHVPSRTSQNLFPLEPRTQPLNSLTRSGLFPLSSYARCLSPRQFSNVPFRSSREDPIGPFPARAASPSIL